MNEFKLNKLSKWVRIPMTYVMARVRILSAHCRHAGHGRGLLRSVLEGQE